MTELQRSIDRAYWAAMLLVVVSCLAGLVVGHSIGQASAIDHAEIHCDVTDLLDRDRWHPIEDQPAPAWRINCTGYTKPGVVIALD